MLKELAEKNLTRLDGYADSLEELTKQYAPEVVDASLMVVQINGIQSLLLGLLLSIITYCLYKAIRLIIKHEHAEEGAAILVAFVLFTLGGAGFYLFNIWNWVAIFEPKLYIAKEVLDKVIN